MFGTPDRRGKELRPSLPIGISPNGGEKNKMKKTKTPNLILKRTRNLRKNSTPQEIILWSRLRAKRFKNLKFKRQYPIGKYIVDFICLDKKIIIELDGWQHKEEDIERYDKKRTEFLENSGFRVIRFWNNDVNNNLLGVFLRIDEYL